MARWIKFLGTAGARVVMIRQLRSSAGVWYHLDGFDLLLDPGPGTLVRCAKSRPPLNPANLNAIVLSHRHLDHSNDVNVMIEAMTEGGFRRRGTLFAPRDCLEGDPVVLHYLRSFPETIVTLESESLYPLSQTWKMRTSLPHHHPVQTYGLFFLTEGLTVAHLVDTAYFEALAEAYAGADVIILHVVRLRDQGDRQRGIQHLNLADAERLIEAVRPRLAVLTHFGMTMLRARPWELAEALTQKLGVRVVAASDGWTLNLDSL